MLRRYAVRWTLVAAVFVMAAQGAAEAATFAQRLGWPEGTRAVILHVDDAGMSHDSNAGTIRAIQQGLATSTSIMMPCPWVTEIRDYLKDHPQVDAGVHLTLTSEWKKYRWGPVSGAAAVPGLVDPDGYLWRSVAEVMSNASADEVEAEIRAQIDRAVAMGITPTHIDSHMGTCFLPIYLDRYVKVGIEKRIPVLMFGGHMQHIGGQAGPFKVLVRGLAETLWNAGLPVIDDLVTSPTKAGDYEGRKQELLGLLRGMQPGVTQIIVHCTAPTETFAQISGSGPAREAELRLMTDPDVKAFIESEGIVLTNWRELKQRRDAVKE